MFHRTVSWCLLCCYINGHCKNEAFLFSVIFFLHKKWMQIMLQRWIWSLVFFSIMSHVVKTKSAPLPNGVYFKIVSCSPCHVLALVVLHVLVFVNRGFLQGVRYIIYIRTQEFLHLVSIILFGLHHFIWTHMRSLSINLDFPHFDSFDFFLQYMGFQAMF